MKKLYVKNSVLHSLVWLALYLVLNTITGNIASAMEVDNHLISAVPNIILMAVCFLYLKKTGIASEIGLFSKPTEHSSTMLFYLPLLILPFTNLLYGYNTALSIPQILLIFAMYIPVGFMEEIIFRGLMYKGLTKKWNRYIVVAFISFTFAIGHIVSMAAINQSGIDTVFQIINAFVVGFLFMIVLIASNNLTICVIAHILYNTIANLSMVGNTKTEMIIVATVITVLYTIYLTLRSKSFVQYFKGTPTE